MMLVVGLTGSLAMGKSTAADMFAELGLGVFDADRTVHALYADAAAPLIEAAFPGTTAGGIVDREKLRERVVGDKAALLRLEAIVHPLVRAEERAFRAKAAAAGHRMIVLDIPLLFETGADANVDAVVVVTTTPAIQRERVFRRPGMTEARLAALLARQMPDADKRARAHFIVDTSGEFDETRKQIADVVRAVAGMAAGK